MKFKASFIEFAAVASICLMLVFLEWRFGVLSMASALLARELPRSSTYLFAIGVALWIGMTVYSLRRRYELFREIEARKALQSDYEVAAITDKVTGLPNRQGLEAYFTALAGPLTSRQDLMLIGVFFSNLKMIADVQGFEAAGTVALKVTARLIEHVRIPDFVACVDGQQFYVLLRDEHDVLANRAAFLIDNLVDKLRSITLTNGATIPLSVHVGTVRLSHCPKTSGLPAAIELVRRCDLAVHEAMTRGSGSVVAFDAAMERSIDQRAVIEASLDDAIRNGEIEPHFQPLIDLVHDTITGFEVLARWKHRTMGQVPPSVFIPIATESGRLEEITIAILNQACRAALEWPGEFKLAFNISPRSLNNERFMKEFMSTLKATRFDRRRIEIEITEDAFVKDASILSAAINRLKGEGISLAIDDFGTGYSSLRHLQIMPFDKIKIDQSFVRDMSANPESRKIVEAIIGLGRSMGLLTVAEGIEAEGDRLMLEKFGCATGQGYLFAKPMPARDVMAFIARRHGANDGGRLKSA
jgi:diguanylate cyclase (GGDEF)-like protein